ncbi:MAG: N-acetylglucosamine-6-phosphate deacetylase [Eubacterium sp.]|nr:N-acetylglucosamine-6-phosphate deacetylase [Eubacterium sp.]
MILKNCTFFNENFEKEFGDIKIENGRISEIGFFTEDGKDMSGKIILPGFVDIHIHGAGGADASDGKEEAFETMSRALSKCGVTSFVGTTMTLPNDRLKSILTAAKGAKVTKSKLIGINLEGPYIAMSKKGAQNGDYVRACDIDEIEELFGIYDKIKLITIAPEASDSAKFISHFKDRLTVSIGHTAANADECKAAINGGISHATHLYNAMTPMTHREAGVAGTALDSDITCELICDGAHICPAVLRNTFKILGENRGVAVSDSMRAAGLGEGEFELGGQTVYVNRGGKTAVLKDGTIAASITNIFEEFKNLLSYGIDFKTALKSCTINPAKAVGEDAYIGSIAVGKCADLIALDEDLNLQEVYIDGILA